MLSDDQLGAVHLLLDRIRARQLQDFGQIGSDVKPDGSLITDCDRWSDAALVEGLASIAPGEGVLSEEGSKTVPNTRAYWVVDPLDGTTNFAAGIPYWAISVARFVDGRPSEVFLDVPALNQRFVALRGRGATRNNQPLTSETRALATSACVSSVQPLDSGVAAQTGSAFSRKDPSAWCRQPQFGECCDGADHRFPGGHAQDLGSGGGLVGAG